jgi:AP-3 complex subunit sigma
MIESILIINKQGVVRFLKIYTLEEKNIDREKLVKTVFDMIASRDSKGSNIIFDVEYGLVKRKLIYRLYGSIYLVMIVDDCESELAIMDFIHVFMQVLDGIFNSICELDIIMNPEKIYLAIDEMISGGIVIETSTSEIIANYKEKLKD